MSNVDPGSKSWFQRWNFRQENINTAQPEQEKEKEFTYLINDRPLNSVKADLIHAFLSTQDLIHNINSPSLFRCEYRAPEKFISRNVRFKVEILTENNNNASTTSNNTPISQTPINNIVNKSNNTDVTVLANNINTNNNNTNNTIQVVPSNPSYKIVFTLLSGSTRHFNSLCKHICMLIGNNTNYTNSTAHHQRQTRLHQQQLKQQQQQVLLQQQHIQSQSPRVTNMNFNLSSPASPYPYHNTAPTTPNQSASIPVGQSPMVQRSDHQHGGGSGSYVTTGSPSITTPITRRNSQNNSSHPSSPASTITTALG